MRTLRDSFFFVLAIVLLLVLLWVFFGAKQAQANSFAVSVEVSNNRDAEALCGAERVFETHPLCVMQRDKHTFDMFAQLGVMRDFSAHLPEVKAVAARWRVEFALDKNGRFPRAALLQSKVYAWLRACADEHEHQSKCEPLTPERRALIADTLAVLKRDPVDGVETARRINAIFPFQTTSSQL